MNTNGHLNVVNLVGIEFVEGGKSVRLEVVESIPPHDTKFLTFRNTYAVQFYQTPDDGFPFILCDLTWRQVEPAETGPTLVSLGYPFTGPGAIPPVDDFRPLVIARLQGSLVGTILAEEVQIQTSSPIQNILEEDRLPGPEIDNAFNNPAH